jgi:hypothetical protein
MLMIERTFHEEFLRCNAAKLIKYRSPQEPIDENLTLLFQFLMVESIAETLVDSRGRVIGSFAMSDRPKIRLMSGLKASGRGNAYMRNAPPRIQVTGLAAGCTVQLDERYFTRIGADGTAEASSVDYKVKDGLVLPDSLAIAVVDRDKLTLARCELRFEDYDVGEVVDPLVNAIGAIIEAGQVADPYRPRGGQTQYPSLPELKVFGRRPGELGSLTQSAAIIEPWLLAEIRGAEKTLHYIGKDMLVIDGPGLSFGVVRNPAFMGPMLTQTWAKFLFEGNVRCGTCAQPFPVSGTYPELSPIRDVVRKQREFIQAHFTARS